MISKQYFLHCTLVNEKGKSPVMIPGALAASTGWGKMDGVTRPGAPIAGIVRPGGGITGLRAAVSVAVAVTATTGGTAVCAPSPRAWKIKFYGIKLQNILKRLQKHYFWENLINISPSRRSKNS